MRVGVDLDNTIISYEATFPLVAKKMALLPESFSGGKSEVRDSLRSQPGGEQLWRDLQAEVYGPEMDLAELMPGVRDFLIRSHQQGVEVVVVSHKSQYATNDRHRVNLRSAAMSWLQDQGLLNQETTGLSPTSIYFEDSRDDKVSRIAHLALDCFVDDLPEVLLHPGFPVGVQRLLYGKRAVLAPGIDDVFNHWEVLADALLCG